MTIRHSLTAAAGRYSPPVPTDPQFNYVSMLLHGDGTNGAQNNTFLDSSTNNFAITRNGNTTQGSLSPYGSLWSNWFSGSSSWLNTPNNAALAMGTGDFTWECFVYLTQANSYGCIFDSRVGGTSGGFFVGYNSPPTTFMVYISSVVISTATLPALNTWQHICLVRAGTTLSLFINGARVATGTDSTNLSNGVINLFGNGNPAFGYLSNVRIVKGTAVYNPNNTTLTVPTTPLTAISGTSLLTCQSNRFIDNSANNFTITRNGDVRVTKEAPFLPTAAYSTSTIGGSGYFGGSGNSLVLASNASFAVGTGPYTIEGWFYFTGSSVGTLDNFLACMGGSFTIGCLTFWYNGSNELQLVAGGGAAASKVAGTITLIPGQWYHIAGTRDASSVQRLFVNGVLLNSATITYSFSQAGFHVNGYSSMTGYAADVRLIVGAAAYTAAFTPPTAPLAAVSGTQVLLKFTNAGIFDNAAENDLQTVGNAQISTSVKKYGTGSLAFDGNGDYLSVPSSANINLSSGNWTIEAWAWCTAGVTSGTILDKDGVNTAAYPSYAVGLDGSGYLRIVVGAGNTVGYFQVVTSGTLMPTGQWVHVAAVKNGTTLTLYQNGVSVASATQTGTIVDGGKPLLVGYSTGQPASSYWNGYIDDLRITKGYARYTANFTPPTAAFPNQ